ncbi:MFS general substrate transporter [Venturia nashicola]|uniref:MFS general substrate transporter n=1 Tax=Venturia nashicola TaxID=86259 RepID=A0A4Z1P8K4_9PEZI|nr:MFS general substrate transporter [Venturia nashicola]
MEPRTCSGSSQVERDGTAVGIQAKAAEETVNKNNEDRMEAGEKTPGPPTKPTRRQQIALLLCGFLACIQTLGLGQAYGMFQLFHKENVGKPTALLSPSEGKNRAAIASVGSIGGSGICLILGLCLVPFLCRSSVLASTGRRSRSRAWPHTVSWISAAGALISFLGYFCASYSTKLWHLALTQGVLVGVGGALLYNPVIMIAPEYFGDKVRGKATGFISAGAGVGGLVYSPLLRFMNEKFGIRVTLWFLGVFVGITGLLIVAFTPPPRPSTRRTFLPKAVRRDPVLYLTLVSGFASSLAALIPYGFGPEFSTLLGSSTKAASIHLIVLNVVGTPARIGWGHVRDKVGSQNAMILASLFLAISNFMWVGAALTNGIAIWVVFLVSWGIGTSGYGTIIAPYVLDVFDSEVYFGILASVNVFRGVGSIIGNPLAGAILGKEISHHEGGSYFKWLITFNGVMLFIAVAALVMARVLIARRTGWKLLA